MSPSSARDWYSVRGWILCATLVLCALAYSFRLTSFLHAKDAVLAVGVCAAAISMPATRLFFREGCRAFLPLWLLVAVSVVVHLVFRTAHVPSFAAVELTRWALLLLAGAIAFPLLRYDAWRQRFLVALAIAGRHSSFATSSEG